MDKLEIAKEIEKIALESNISILELTEHYKKALSLATTQEKEQTNNISNILTDNYDLDNNEIYDINTGQTICEL